MIIRLALTTAAAALLALSTAACGGSSSSATSASSSPTPAMSSAAPKYVENDTCRTEAKAFFDVVGTLSSNEIDSTVLEQKLAGAQAKVDRAMEACTPAVNDLVRQGMFSLASANAGLKACTGLSCPEVEADYTKAIDDFRDAASALDAYTD